MIMSSNLEIRILQDNKDEFYVEISKKEEEINYDKLIDDSEYRNKLYVKYNIDENKKNRIESYCRNEAYKVKGIFSDIVSDNVSNIASSYYVYNKKEKRFVRINNLPTDINTIKKYDNAVTFDEIKKDIENIIIINKEKLNTYSVYKCNCGNLFYLKSISNVSICEKCDKNAIALFSGTKIDAFNYYNEEINKSNIKIKEEIKVKEPYLYDGKRYIFTLNDFKALNELLYKNSDYNEILEKDIDGIKFKQKYQNYLDVLNEYKLIEFDSYYFNNEFDLMTNFYMYLMENNLISDERLIWDKNCFNNVDEYVNSLLYNHKLLKAFNYTTAQYFFKIDYNFIDLSALIYKTINRFISINYDIIYDFGNNIFEELLKDESLIEQKIMFIHEIKQSDNFLDVLDSKLKSIFYLDYYGSSYEEAAFYYFEFTGEKELKYKNLCFRCFKNLNELKEIIINSYRSRKNDKYIILKELVNCNFFRDKPFAYFNRINENYMDKLINEFENNPNYPSLEFYLYSLDEVNENTLIYYDKKLNNLREIISSINDSNFINELIDILNNDDIKYYINYLCKDNKNENEYNQKIEEIIKISKTLRNDILQTVRKKTMEAK